MNISARHTAAQVAGFPDADPQTSSADEHSLAGGFWTWQAISAFLMELKTTQHLYVATAGIDLPWHSWATSASHGRASAYSGATVAAKTLAMTGVDFLLDEDLRRRAKAEFDEK